MIDVFFKDGAVSDVITAERLSIAADVVVRQCVLRGADHSGGYIRDLGKKSSQLLISSRVLFTPMITYGLIKNRRFPQHSLSRQPLPTIHKLLRLRRKLPHGQPNPHRSDPHNLHHSNLWPSVRSRRRSRPAANVRRVAARGRLSARIRILREGRR